MIRTESPSTAGRIGNPNQIREQLHKYTKRRGKQNAEADLGVPWQKATVKTVQRVTQALVGATREITRDGNTHHAECEDVTLDKKARPEKRACPCWRNKNAVTAPQQSVISPQLLAVSPQGEASDRQQIIMYGFEHKAKKTHPSPARAYRCGLCKNDYILHCR